MYLLLKESRCSLKPSLSTQSVCHILRPGVGVRVQVFRAGVRIRSPWSRYWSDTKKGPCPWDIQATISQSSLKEAMQHASRKQSYLFKLWEAERRGSRNCVLWWGDRNISDWANMRPMGVIGVNLLLTPSSDTWPARVHHQPDTNVVCVNENWNVNIQNENRTKNW